MRSVMIQSAMPSGELKAVRLRQRFLVFDPVYFCLITESYRCIFLALVMASIC
jgi:hypothetical protein